MTEHLRLAPVWRDRNFALFWAAQAISRFGDPITLVVLAYVAYARTGSALLTAVAVLITTAPAALFGLLGGSVADALGYRRAMVTVDLSRAVLIGVMPLLIRLDAPLSLLYLVAFASSICGSVFGPARFALVPSLVPARRLGEGNALLVSTDRAVEILGSLVAGALVVTVGSSAFYFDAATFGISALLLGGLKLEDQAPRLSVREMFAGALDGARFIRRSSKLFANTIFSIAAQLSLPIANGLTPALLIRNFAGGNAELGAAQFALAEATLAIGAVGSGLVARPLATRFGKGQLLIVGFATYGAMLVVLSFAARLEIALAIFAGLGFANVMFYVPNLTAVQELAPDRLRGRVIGARLALLNLSWLPAIGLAGALADIYPVAALIGLAGVLTTTVAAVGSLIPIVREIP